MESERNNSKLENTLQAGAWSGVATIPVIEGIFTKHREHREGATQYRAGKMVGRYRLIRHLCDGNHSTLFLGEDRNQKRVVVKLYDPGFTKSTPALCKLGDLLRRKGCPSLMPLLSYGDLDDSVHFEVMPVYQQGTLATDVVTEEEITNHILPQMNEALRFLGENHLVHNDIKPANIFWTNREKKEIVLGDYDCLTTDREEMAGGTLLYMAPERIFTKGRVHTSASDYCSLGLTLITLLQGRALLDETEAVHTFQQDQLSRYLFRRWQRPVSCPPSLHLSAKTRELLNRLIQINPEVRYSGEYISSWIKNGGIGVEAYGGKDQVTLIKGLPYRESLIMDINELVQTLGRDWDYGSFLLHEHQLDDFLRQFNGRYYSYCQEYAKDKDKSAGFFKLLLTIHPSVDFYWLGTHYRSMEEFVEQTETRELYGRKDPFCRFCRSHLLSFYEQQAGASHEQLARAREIEEKGRFDPKLAVEKLQISLRQKPDFVWRGVSFLSLEDLLDYLEGCQDRLDEEIGELYGSAAFQVWLDYIQHGKLIPTVRKHIMESGI